MKSYISLLSFRGTMVALMITVLSIGCRKGDPQSESIRPVYYQEINRSSANRGFAVPGVIQYAEEARLSFRVSGLLKELSVGVGQKVSKGQVLAALDDVDYMLLLRQAEASGAGAAANAKNAQAQLTNAKSNFLRSEQLYMKNNLSLGDFEQVKAQYENARAKLAAANAELALSNARVVAARNQLGYTNLIAPMDGTISQVLLVKNEMIGAGKPVLVMSMENNYEVKTVVPESWVNELAVGQEVLLQIASLQQELVGHIREVSPSAPTNNGYPVKISVVDAGNRLKSGMSCKIVVPTLKNVAQDQLVVDADAVFKVRESSFVYLLKKQDNEQYMAVRTQVETGPLTKEGYHILSGIEVGDLIATAGIRFLYDGKMVTLMDQPQL